MRRERIGAKADLSEEHPRADLRGPCGERVLVTQCRMSSQLAFSASEPPRLLTGVSVNAGIRFQSWADISSEIR